MYNDICFDLDGMQLIYRDSFQAENKINEIINGSFELPKKLEEEISSFDAYGKQALSKIHNCVSQVRDMIDTVNGKISLAESKRQQEISPPSQPSIPQNATPEQRTAIMSSYNEQLQKVKEQNARIQRENGRIDEYIEKCKDASGKLEAIIIPGLNQLYFSAKPQIEHTLSSSRSYMKIADDTVNRTVRINHAMKEFDYTLTLTYQAAQNIYMMSPSRIKSESYIDNQFKVKNTHIRISVSSGINFNFNDRQSASAVDVTPTDPTDELLINNKDAKSFLERVNGLTRFKMPSANLHRLGGKAFIAEMNAIGCFIVTQPNGSTIDDDGMIHWEKQHE